MSCAWPPSSSWTWARWACTVPSPAGCCSTPAPDLPPPWGFSASSATGSCWCWPRTGYWTRTAVCQWWRWWWWWWHWGLQQAGASVAEDGWARRKGSWSTGGAFQWVGASRGPSVDRVSSWWGPHHRRRQAQPQTSLPFCCCPAVRGSNLHLRK